MIDDLPTEDLHSRRPDRDQRAELEEQRREIRELRSELRRLHHPELEDNRYGET
jgi:hypothetical protein